MRATRRGAHRLQSAMPVRAVLFDLDDTLLETHHAHHAAVQRACERVAERYPEWTAARMVEAFTEAYRVVEQQLEAGTLKITSHRQFRQLSWEETLRSCRLSPAMADELTELYLAERRSRYALFPDVPAVLDELQSQYTLVLVTNGLGELQREKVAAVGLERWFSRLAISGELGSWKPDAGIFRHALELAGATADEAVMVGDALERDVTGAGALGIRTVWVRRYPHLEPMPGIRPDAELPNLVPLPRLLRDWSA
jgi:putative hydrolase of the HAD superfamily